MNMLKAKLNKKLGKNGGFTLVEMLIVVAIIAILVAVSIPLVSSSLEKARQATDDANKRAAKAEGAIVYLDAVANDNWTATGNTVYWYDAAKGELVPEGQKPSEEYGKTSDNIHNFVKVTITKEGKVTAEWAPYS